MCHYDIWHRLQFSPQATTAGHKHWKWILSAKGEKYKTNLHLFGLRGHSIYNLFKYSAALEFGWLWGRSEKENYPAF